MRSKLVLARPTLPRWWLAVWPPTKPCAKAWKRCLRVAVALYSVCAASTPPPPNSGSGCKGALPTDVLPAAAVGPRVHNRPLCVHMLCIVRLCVDNGVMVVPGLGGVPDVHGDSEREVWRLGQGLSAYSSVSSRTQRCRKLSRSNKATSHAHETCRCRS